MGQIKSALAWKCPRCNQGELFERRNPYSPGKMLAMHSHCGHCGLRYEKETGFFFGAMYVSYMINIGLFVMATLAWYLFFDGKMDWRLYIGGFVLSIIVLVPVIYRFSRAFWLVMMVKFEPEKRGER